LVMEGKVSAAMKFLDKEHSAGVLELDEKVINDLKEKHPQSEPPSEQGLLEGPVRTVPHYYFEPIDEQGGHEGSIEDERLSRAISNGCRCL